MAGEKLPTGEKAISFLIDGSGSISASNYENQIIATANALRHPEVLAELDKIFKRGGSVAFNALTFGSTTRQLLGWQEIRSRADVERFANQLAASGGFQPGGGTPMDTGILTSGATFTQLESQFGGRFKHAEWVMDISSDGEPDSMLSAANAAREFERLAYSNRTIGRINGIGIGEPAFKALRDNIISKPHGKAWSTDWTNFEKILVDKLKDELIGTGPAKTRRAEVEIPGLGTVQLADVADITHSKDGGTGHGLGHLAAARNAVGQAPVYS